MSTYYKAPINIHIIYVVTYKRFNFYYTESFNSHQAFLFFQKFCLPVLKKPTGINLTQQIIHSAYIITVYTHFIYELKLI